MTDYVSKVIEYDNILRMIQEYFKKRNINAKVSINSEIDPEEELGVKTTFHVTGKFGCNKKEIVLTQDQVKDILDEVYFEKENKHVVEVIDRAAAITDEGKIGTYENPATKVICEYFSIVTKEDKKIYFK